MNNLISLGVIFFLPSLVMGAETIDFEPAADGTYGDGSVAVDNLEITDQFLLSHGISFGIDNDLNASPDPEATSYRLETHYFVNTQGGGTDNGTFAFYNSIPHNGGGTKRDIEREGFEGRLGAYMLTPTTRGDTLLITYQNPTANASGEIWDLDNSTNGDYEQILVEALSTDGFVIESILSPPGGPANQSNPYEGGPWIWSFARDEADVGMIRMRSVGTGKKANAPLAFDNFKHDEAFVGVQPALENAGVSEIETTVYLPSMDEWFTIAYEDLYPNRGDYDFNDLVISYRCTLSLNGDGDVVQFGGEAYLRARGAGYVHDWNLTLDLDNSSLNGGILVAMTNPEDGNAVERQSTFSGGIIDIPVIRDSRQYFLANDDAEGNGKANVWANQVRMDGPHFVWTVTLDNPVALAEFPDAPYTPILSVRDTDEEIYLDTRDEGNGLPFAFLVPVDWQHPLENVDLGEAYPAVLSYIESGGMNDVDWYLQPVADKVFDKGVGWDWRAEDGD